MHGSKIFTVMRLLSLLGVTALTLLLAAPGWAVTPTTRRLSVSSSGVEADAEADNPAISGTGRFTVWDSDATTLVGGDSNASGDVFIRDRSLGTTRRVSVNSNEVQGNSSSQHASISADGRYVVFDSSASNLVPNDSNGQIDAFIRDRRAGTTRIVSVRSNGNQGNGASYEPKIAANGRFVVFTSEASNLVSGDTNAARDVFIRDLVTNTTRRVSLTSAEAQGNGGSQDCVISANGNVIAFISGATNMVAGDSNGLDDIYVRDRAAGTTRRVNLSSAGAQADAFTDRPQISGNGRFVVFSSQAANLVGSDTNANADVFIRDRTTRTTRLVSMSSAEVQGEAASYSPGISSDGRYVVFTSDSTNLIPSDTNGVQEIFLRDRKLGTTIRVSVRSAGGEADDFGEKATISADGRFVAFLSDATNLVGSDTNAIEDAFIRGPLI